MKVTSKAGKIDALRQSIKTLNASEGKVGWFESAKYEGGEPVAGVAYVQEYGSPKMGVPPRLGLRNVAADKQKEWAHTAENISRAAARGQIAPENVMTAVCLAAEGDARKQIATVTSPPLKPATVAARRRRLADGGAGARASIEKPLVDTGIMLNTLTSQVTTK